MASSVKSNTSAVWIIALAVNDPDRVALITASAVTRAVVVDRIIALAVRLPPTTTMLWLMIASAVNEPPVIPEIVAFAVNEATTALLITALAVNVPLGEVLIMASMLIAPDRVDRITALAV